MAHVIANDAQQHVEKSTPAGWPWLRAKIADPYRSLLLLRFALLNVVAFALLSAAWSQGYVATVITADQTYLSVIIFLVFVVGLAICAHKVWQTSNEIDCLNSPHGTQSPTVAHLFGKCVVSTENRTNAESSPHAGSLSSSVRLRLAHRISVVRHLANTLVLLGLIGTVLGFIIALSGVDPEQAADVNAIAPMVSTLIRGMSTALYTTLIGSILNVWLMANYQMLSGGTVQLIARLSEEIEYA